MLKIYGYRNSRASRVVWALEEGGADYEYVHVDLKKGEGRREPLRHSQSFRQSIRNNPDRDQTKIRWAVWRCLRGEFAIAVTVLEKGLHSKEYIAGAQFSIADVLVGHTLAWARSARVSLGFDSVEKYADRILARPGLARATERMRLA